MQTQSLTASASPGHLFKEQKTSCLLPQALAVIALLGGIFLLLAAYQVLPHHHNLISELGTCGKLSGAILIVGGLAIACLACLRSCCCLTDQPSHAFIAPSQDPSIPSSYTRAKDPADSNSSYELATLSAQTQQSIRIKISQLNAQLADFFEELETTLASIQTMKGYPAGTPYAPLLDELCTFIQKLHDHLMTYENIQRQDRKNNYQILYVQTETLFDQIQNKLGILLAQYYPHKLPEAFTIEGRLPVYAELHRRWLDILSSQNTWYD